jgi:hypothetical protein
VSADACTDAGADSKAFSEAARAELLQQFADLELQAAGITNTRECEEVQMESSPIGGWPCGAQEDELGTDSIIQHVRWFQWFRPLGLSWDYVGARACIWCTCASHLLCLGD